MTRDELIAALEKAAGPDRELDGDIYKAAHPKFTLDHPHMHGRLLAINKLNHCPRYTASIDAALTLVPAQPWLSWIIEGGTVDESDPSYGGNLAKIRWENAEDGKPEPIRSSGATPAIALCIAALKAHPE